MSATDLWFVGIAAISVFLGRKSFRLLWLVLKLRFKYPEARTLLTLGGRPAPAPEDPTHFTTRLVIFPGQGPGEAFWAPGPSMYPRPRLDSGGSGMDATIKLTDTAFVLVVRNGPLSAGSAPAPERADLARQSWPAAERRGPVEYVETGAGMAYRHTRVYANGQHLLTDWHLDHEGWAFIIGFLRAPADESLMAVVERMMWTWQWLPPAPSWDWQWLPSASSPTGSPDPV